MKFKIIFVTILIYANSLVSCPLCEGKIKAESPAFFSDEFYQPNNGNAVARTAKEQIGSNEFRKLIESKRGKK